MTTPAIDPDHVRSARSTTGSEGFTFLEMLLVLMILSICAGMAYPRLSGVYAQTRFEHQKNAIAGLVRHGERTSRLLGAPLVLTWDEATRRLSLVSPRPWSHLLSSAPLRDGPQGERVPAAAFLSFAFDSPVVGAVIKQRISDSKGEFAGTDLPNGPGLAASSWRAVNSMDDVLVDEIRLEPGVDLHPSGLPLLITPDGRTSSASLVLSKGSESDECVIPALAASVSWSRP
jgi:prepilin-type N-terminal cleavage/methylation domain-containing protein